MKRIKTALATLALVVGCTVGLVAATSTSAFAEAGDSGDNGCTNSTFSGTVYNGSWSRGYNPNCNDNTVGQVDISWGNYNDTFGAHHIWWHAAITAGAIAGSQCIEVALDWHNPLNGHSDVQFERQCYENSTYDPSVQPQDLISDAFAGGSSWYVQRLQIAVFDPSDSSVVHVTCPGGSGTPGLTNFDGHRWNGTDATGCLGFLSRGAATWSSTAAKIYRKDNSGNPANNDPTYPDNYTIQKQKDPNN